MMMQYTNVAWASNTAGLVIMSAVAAWWDVRSSRIPNWITVSGFAMAFVTSLFMGWSALGAALLGAVLAAVLSVPLFFVHALGGGDVKLLIAVGAFLGPHRLLIAVVATAVAGTLLAIVEATRRGVILPALLNVRDFFVYWLTFGQRGKKPHFMNAEVAKVPYGVAIAVGALIGRFW